MQARVHARRSLTGDMDWDVEDPLHDAFLIVFYFIQALLMLNFFLAIILVSYDKCVQRVVDQVRPLPVPARYNAFFLTATLCCWTFLIILLGCIGHGAVHLGGFVRHCSACVCPTPLANGRIYADQTKGAAFCRLHHGGGRGQASHALSRGDPRGGKVLH